MQGHSWKSRVTIGSGLVAGLLLALGAALLPAAAAAQKGSNYSPPATSYLTIMEFNKTSSRGNALAVPAPGSEYMMERLGNTRRVYLWGTTDHDQAANLTAGMDDLASAHTVTLTYIPSASYQATLGPSLEDSAMVWLIEDRVHSGRVADFENAQDTIAASAASVNMPFSRHVFRAEDEPGTYYILTPIDDYTTIELSIDSMDARMANPNTAMWNQMMVAGATLDSSTASIQQSILGRPAQGR